MEEVVENKAPIKRWLNIPMLYDVDARLRIMDTFGEYQQILTLSAPPIEAMAGPDVTPGLARMANDGMADLVKKYPDRFPRLHRIAADEQPGGILQGGGSRD